jgi:hypothetical protein
MTAFNPETDCNHYASGRCSYIGTPDAENCRDACEERVSFEIPRTDSPEELKEFFGFVLDSWFGIRDGVGDSLPSTDEPLE